MSQTKRRAAICPVCTTLGERSSVKRMQPIETRSDFCAMGHNRRESRFRYVCSRGHEFDGEVFVHDICDKCRVKDAKYEADGGR